SVGVVGGGTVRPATGDPAACGLAPAAPGALRGGDAAHNADVVRRVLAGEPGPVRDAVLLNAGAALAVYDAAQGGLDDRLAAGLDRARAAVDTGAAADTLRRWVEATRGAGQRSST
ncbi:MAG TPA: anthranilate phosphoribosyltransferase, partial [Nocardioides sp.]|nr:anthranilate phosphoribosyltransferase [Nocardioides sp.]